MYVEDDSIKVEGNLVVSYLYMYLVYVRELHVNNTHEQTCFIGRPLGFCLSVLRTEGDFNVECIDVSGCLVSCDAIH